MINNLVINGLVLLLAIKFFIIVFTPRKPIKNVSLSDSNAFLRKNLTLIVIDALRFDFACNEQITEYPSLKFLSELQVTDKGQLFEFIADPPTATSQRLTAITSGTIPVFIEAGANFASNEIQSDNFIFQLFKKTKNIHIYGDDTWMHLFPFLKDTIGNIDVYWSFGLFDLHTIDSNIEKKLLEKKEKDVVIAHFLGFDHCGHLYGPRNELCHKKLEEYDLILSKYFSNTQPEERIIVVIGDHGMTNGGDHGGDSALELSSVLFINRPKVPILSDFQEKVKKIREEYINTSLNVCSHSRVSQIDLTPTISMLLGLPIPYNNIGNIIPEVFISNELSYDENIRNLYNIIKANSNQIINYLLQYFEDTIEATELKEFENRIKVLDMSSPSEASFLNLYSINYELANYCRKKWSNVNVFSACFVIIFILFFSLSLFITCLKNLILPFLFCLIYFSTSFIIFEEWILQFFIISFSFFIYQIDLNSLLFLRFTSFISICREEQFPFCTDDSKLESVKFVIISLYTIYFVCKNLKSKKNILFGLGLSILWFLRMYEKIESSLHIFTTWLHRCLFFLSLVFQDDLLGKIISIFGCLQRPLSGLGLLNIYLFLHKNSKFLTINSSFFYSLLILFSIFITGHNAVLTSIHWESAFFGIDKQLPHFFAGLLILINFLSGPLIIGLHLNDLKILEECISIFSIFVSASTLANFLLLKHLMIWKIFAPRFCLQLGIYLALLSIYSCKLFYRRAANFVVKRRD